MVRSVMSQVKIRVRRDALLLRSFTAVDIVGSTGLNPASVRTELRRMRGEGLLTSTRGGGREARYAITDDAEKRLTLSQSLQAFDKGIFKEVSPELAQPLGRHYRQAQRQLDEAMYACVGEREQLLAQAAEWLDKADEEENSVFASENVQSYLGYECARLAYLRGQHEAAERSFQLLLPFFESIDDSERVQAIDDFLYILRELDKEKADFATAGPAHSLRQLVQKHRERGPLLIGLADMLDEVPQRTSSMGNVSSNHNAAKAFFSVNGSLNPLPAAALVA